MSSRGPVVLTAALVLSVLLATPAMAEQLAAKDDPKVSDNLVQQGKKCATERDEHDGTVVAVVKACQRFFTLDPAAEDNEARDYGVLWLQSTIDPKPGWCVTAAKSDMVFPARAKLAGRTPEAEETAKRSKRLKTELAADAGGHAATAGTISQTSTLFPDKQTPSLKKRDKTTQFRLTWTGSSDEKLAFVSGVHVSWATEDGPPKNTRFGLRKYTLVEKDPC
jgi:hypothetical protein